MRVRKIARMRDPTPRVSRCKRVLGKCLPAGFDSTLIHLIYRAARARFGKRYPRGIPRTSDPSSKDDDNLVLVLVLDHRPPCISPPLFSSSFSFVAGPSGSVNFSLYSFTRAVRRGLTCHSPDIRYKTTDRRRRGNCGG